MTPHPNAGKTCRCGRGKSSGYDGKCGNCRSARERKVVDQMREGWSLEAAQRGYKDARDRMADQFEDLP